MQTHQYVTIDQVLYSNLTSLQNYTMMHGSYCLPKDAAGFPIADSCSQNKDSFYTAWSKPSAASVRQSQRPVASALVELLLVSLLLQKFINSLLCWSRIVSALISISCYVVRIPATGSKACHSNLTRIQSYQVMTQGAYHLSSTASLLYPSANDVNAHERHQKL